MAPTVNQNLCVQVFGANAQLNVIRHFIRQNKSYGARDIKNASWQSQTSMMRSKALNVL